MNALFAPNISAGERVKQEPGQSGVGQPPRPNTLLGLDLFKQEPGQSGAGQPPRSSVYLASNECARTESTAESGIFTLPVGNFKLLDLRLPI